MATLWDGVRTLGGRTLWTVRGKGFDVAVVSAERVRIVVHSSGRPYSIPREEFDRAEAMGLAISGITPSQLRKAGASEFHPAYVAAIIHAVLGPE